MKSVSSKQAGAEETAVGLRGILLMQGGVLSLYPGPAPLPSPGGQGTLELVTSLALWCEMEEKEQECVRSQDPPPQICPLASIQEETTPHPS